MSECDEQLPLPAEPDEGQRDIELREEVSPELTLAARDIADVAHRGAEFSEEQLVAGVEASNVRVIWRGGIPIETCVAVAVALAIEAGVILLAWNLVISGRIWNNAHTPKEDPGRFVFVPTMREDGGRSGTQEIGSRGRMVQDAPGIETPDVPDPFAQSPELLPSHPDNDNENGSFRDTDVGPPRVVTLGTGSFGPRNTSGPRSSSGRPGAGGAVANANGGNKIGDGGTGMGIGHGNGNGIDRGLSIDDPVKLLRGPKLEAPLSYRNGYKTIKHAVEIAVWVKPNNKVEKVELIESSGDDELDRYVMDFYGQQSYLAGTTDGEPALKAYPVRYGAAEE